MNIKERIKNLKNQANHTIAKQAIALATFCCCLCGMHAQAKEDMQKNPKGKAGDKKEIQIQGNANLLNPILTVNTNEKTNIL